MGRAFRLSIPPLTAGLAAALAALGLVAAGCKTDGAVSPAPAPPPRRDAGLRAYGPARYHHLWYAWVERTAAGTDLVVTNGRRLEVSATSIVRAGAAEPTVEGGAVIPAWVKGSARYVFWKDRDVYVASTFLGDLVKIGATPMEVTGDAFDWIDGAGLSTESGTYVVIPGTAPDLRDSRLVSIPVPGAAEGLAADAKRAIVTNVFGRSLLTTDGGKTFRDIHEEVGEISDYEVRGEDLVIRATAGRKRFVGPDGKVSEAAVAPGPLRGAEPPDVETLFGEVGPREALSTLGDGAIPLGGGVLLTVAGNKVAKIDAETGRVLTSTALEDIERESCTPVRLPDAILLTCRGSERAMVIDVTGVPKIERTFEVSPQRQEQLDGFSVADGIGVGYLGPCEGPLPQRDEVDGVSGASQRNVSPQRSPVFCARASADHWIEHHLDPDDAAAATGWMPRPGGDAVALVARLGRVVPDEQRVTVRGGLRVVRIPRTEPPLEITGYAGRGAVDTVREMRAAADGSIEAWLMNNTYGNNLVAVVIDPEGHSHVRPVPPRVGSIAHDGPFALASGDDGRIYETIDWGRRWVDVKPPPADQQEARPSRCSAAGCTVGQFVRIGWDSVDASIPAAAIDYETGRAAARDLREQYDYRRPPKKPTAVQLVCSYASPGEGARSGDPYGFGFSSSMSPRGYNGSSRLGWIGAFMLPWWQGPMPSGTDVDFAWVDPFDLDGKIHRVTVPLSRSVSSLEHRPYEQRLGYVIDEDGRVDVIATGHKETCLAPALEDAGAVLQAGACLPDPSMGVRIRDRILLGSARWGSLAISVLDLAAASGGGAGSEVRELRTLRAPGTLRGYTAGIGVRAGQPVGVAVDGRGEAVAAPIDPNDGYIGEAVRLAPLSALRVGSDEKCPTTEKLGEDEARVLLPFDTAIGLSTASMPGVAATGSAGVAVVRWSRDLACLEAVEMNVRDERYDPDAYYEQAGVIRKVIARFVKAPPRRGGSDKGRPAPKKAAPAASASASASAAASPGPLPPWASPYGIPPAPTATSSASAGPTTAPIPTSPPLPKGAGEGTLLLIQNGSELRQKLFCTGTTP